MARFFTRNEVDSSVLRNKKIAIIGYGNQGRAQAINLRQAGYQVLVGNQQDASWDQARKDGFSPSTVASAAADADVIMLLLPDEIAPGIYDESIKPHLTKGKTLLFASGYNITYKHIVPPADVDVILVAPRMIGQGVLDLPARGQGFPVLVGIHQDATGSAQATMLAIADGIGAFLPQGAVVESSCDEETMVDVFSEHTWAGAMLFMIEKAFKVLVESGVSQEVALLELYASGELGEIGHAIAERGLWHQLKLHSHTSQFGQLTHGEQFLGEGIEKAMRDTVSAIRDGSFAKVWREEQAQGSPRFHQLLAQALASPTAKTEDELYRKLGRR